MLNKKGVTLNIKCNQILLLMSISIVNKPYSIKLTTLIPKTHYYLCTNIFKSYTTKWVTLYNIYIDIIYVHLDFAYGTNNSHVIFWKIVIIGLADKDRDGEWTWMHSNLVQSYHSWVADEPDEGRTYAHMDYRYNFDWREDGKSPYPICQL